jgi:hypothetical protein
MKWRTNVKAFVRHFLFYAVVIALQTILAVTAMKARLQSYKLFLEGTL